MSKRLKTVLVCVLIITFFTFVLCASAYKMYQDPKHTFFGVRFQYVSSQDKCALNSDTLAIISKTESYTNTATLSCLIDKTLVMLPAYDARATDESTQVLGAVTSQIPILGAVVRFFISSELLMCALFVLLALLFVFVLFNKKQESPLKKQQSMRLKIGALFTIITNSYVIGHLKGSIYKGDLKHICVPGLNCYSCPGALGACPIGAMQAIMNKRTYTSSGVSATREFPFYALGFIMVFGAIMGRLVCGFLCPFGWIQELLYKIPIKKLKRPASKAAKSIDGYARYIKYFVLVILVFVLPLFASQAFPWFCKLVCPSGMLFGGLGLMSVNDSLREAAGGFTVLKLAVLFVVAISSVILFRPFCKYLCPLGAMYGLLNPISGYRYHIDEAKCVKCQKCRAVCPMGVDPIKNPNSTECIRCGECKAVCPAGAIYAGFAPRKVL